MSYFPAPERRTSPTAPTRSGDPAIRAADPTERATHAWETDGGALRARAGVLTADDAGRDLVVRIVTVPDGVRAEVGVHGELDLESAPRLRAAVADACRADPGPGRGATLVLDLTEVTFMDSAALHTLADIDAEVTARGWSLQVTPPAGRGPHRLLALAARHRWLAPMKAGHGDDPGRRMRGHTPGPALRARSGDGASAGGKG